MNSESETLSLEELGESQQKELKEIAAKAIESRVTGKKSEIKVTDIILKKKAGVFVTINRFGQLRGCIGYILPYYELWEATAKAAAEAAVSDPRFISIDKDEIGTL